MAYMASGIGRIALKAQSGGWGKSNAESSFSATDYVDCEVVVPAPVQEALKAELMRGNWHAQKVVAGAKGDVEVTLSMPLHGWSADGTSIAADPSVHPDALMAASALGAAIQDGYDADFNGGTASAPTFDDSGGDGVDNNIYGQGLLIPVGSDTWDAMFVADLDTVSSPNDASVLVDLAATPRTSGAGAVCFGSNTVYLGTAQHSPLTMQWLGGDSSAAIRFYDGVVTSYQVSGGVRSETTLQATIRFGGYIIDGSGGGPGQYAVSWPRIGALTSEVGGRVVMASAAPGTPTATALTLGSFTLTITNEVVPVEDVTEETGIGSYITTRREVTLETTEKASSVSSLTAPGTALGAIQVTVGVTPGKAFAFVMPAAQTEGLDELGDDQGVVAVSRTLSPGYYASDGGAGAGAGNSPFRMAWM